MTDRAEMNSKNLPQELYQALQVSFPSMPLSLIGCRSAGYAHPVCEYDVLVVTKGELGTLRSFIGGYYVDLHFITAMTLKDIWRSKLAIPFYRARHISDPDWILTSTSSRLKSLGIERLKHTVLTRRMRSALVKMGRFYDAFFERSMLDAAYWLQSASYDYSDCATALMGNFPSPSHTMYQMQKYSRAASSDSFTVWSEALGMDFATSAGAMRRLETLLTILKPLRESKERLRESLGNWSFNLTASPYYFQVTEEKVRHLVKAHKVLEAYCYLGREVVKAVEEFYALRCAANNSAPTYSRILTVLSKNHSTFHLDPNRMLDFNAEESALRTRGQNLKRLIDHLGRKLP